MIDPLEASARMQGEARFHEFIGLLSTLHAQSMALTLTIGACGLPHVNFSDDSLAAIEADAMDVVNAANALAGYATRLALTWKEQRDRMRAEE